MPLRMILCVAPNPSVDKLFAVDRVVPGDIHRPQAFTQVAGGKALNAARAAAALGAEVRVAALLSGKAGAWIAEQLADSGIELFAAWGDGETRACLSVAEAEVGRLTEFYESGPAVEPGAWEAFLRAVAAACAGVSYVAVSGSLPPGAPPDGHAELVSLAHRARARVALDAAGESLELALAARPELVKVNQAEAASLGGRADPADAAAQLRWRAGGDGHAAVVTLGEEGAVGVDPDGASVKGGIDAHGPYPVGSGDAFLGGLCAALDAGAGFAGAFTLALGAAAANAEEQGAGVLRPERARALAVRARLER